MNKITVAFLAVFILIGARSFAQNDDVVIDGSGNVETGVSSPIGGGNLDVTGSSGEHAIFGSATGTGAAGVYGERADNNNYGYLGGDSYGVFGFGAGTNVGVEGQNSGGSYGRLGSPIHGVYGSNSTYFGVYGHSFTGYGVFGYATSGDAIHGANPGTGYAGYFEGKALVTGDLTVNGTLTATISETDPTVAASVKDGVDWSELTGIPAGFADGTDNDTTYSAGTGLNLNGTTFRVNVPLSLSGSSTTGIIETYNSDLGGRGIGGNSTGQYGLGVFGASTGTAGKGVYGWATNSTGSNYGGYFVANGTSGYGVYGEATGSSGYGVYGSAAATGAVTNYGGYFSASGNTGRGVYGYAVSAGAASNYGGYFHASGIYGRGVYGEAPGSSGYGVYGYASGSNGRGVYGYATATGSVVNHGGYFSASGDYGRGVYGEATGSSGYGVYGYASSGSALFGYAPGNTGRGVYGYAAATGSVINYGGYFIASGNTGRGVYSEAPGTTAIGVYSNGGQYDFYAGGAGTNYGPFTGGHEVLLSGDFPGDIQPGMIVSVTGKARMRKDEENNVSISSTLPSVRLADTPNDRAVFGAFVKESSLPEEHWYKKQEGERFGIVNALGEGRVWITNVNGNIDAGDYITTSSIPGYGQRQDDDLLHSYTLGKAIEDVDWDSVSESITVNGQTVKIYLIAVVYTSG